jgi:hypothetical protein
MNVLKVLADKLNLLYSITCKIMCSMSQFFFFTISVDNYVEQEMMDLMIPVFCLWHIALNSSQVYKPG